MAAVGLIPDYKMVANDANSVRRHMTALVEYIKEMRIALQEINSHSYNNFMLRVGVNVGAVVAGVIGARKPQYDIWGNTVNVASRMDSTGIPGYTQVTQEVVDSLQGSHFEFRCRGTIKVKGKGDMVTYFLCDSPNTGLNGEIRNAMISNHTLIPPTTQTPPSNQQLHPTEYYQKQSQFKDNNYHNNINSSYNNISEMQPLQTQNRFKFNKPQNHLSNIQENGVLYNNVNHNGSLNKPPPIVTRALQQPSHSHRHHLQSQHSFPQYHQPHQIHHQQQPGMMVIRENFNIIENPNINLNNIGGGAVASAAVGTGHGQYLLRQHSNVCATSLENMNVNGRNQFGNNIGGCNGNNNNNSSYNSCRENEPLLNSSSMAKVGLLF